MRLSAHRSRAQEVVLLDAQNAFEAKIVKVTPEGEIPDFADHDDAG